MKITRAPVLSLFLSPLFIYSFLAALLVGLSAPVVGTYLVHRRLAMLGDGIGHVALTGVAVGWLVGSLANLTPIDRFAVPGAIVASVAAAVVIELVRRSGRTSADVVLALLFYGGIAAGVVLIGLAGGILNTTELIPVRFTRDGLIGRPRPHCLYGPGDIRNWDRTAATAFLGDQ
jgi:ABC-type Mn2+/Zn2+ transport system permease subunit